MIPGAVQLRKFRVDPSGWPPSAPTRRATRTRSRRARPRARAITHPRRLREDVRVQHRRCQQSRPSGAGATRCGGSGCSPVTSVRIERGRRRSAFHPAQRPTLGDAARQGCGRGAGANDHRTARGEVHDAPGTEGARLALCRAALPGARVHRDRAEQARGRHLDGRGAAGVGPRALARRGQRAAGGAPERPRDGGGAGCARCPTRSEAVRAGA